MLTKVATTKAPAAIGPYSQGIIVNGMLYASGQIPIIPATGEIAQGDITVQAKQVMLNIGEILKEAGTTYEKRGKDHLFFWMIWQILQHLMQYMSSTLPVSRQEAVLQ